MYERVIGTGGPFLALYGPSLICAPQQKNAGDDARLDSCHEELGWMTGTPVLRSSVIAPPLREPETFQTRPGKINTLQPSFRSAPADPCSGIGRARFQRASNPTGRKDFEGGGGARSNTGSAGGQSAKGGK